MKVGAADRCVFCRINPALYERNHCGTAKCRRAALAALANHYPLPKPRKDRG